MSVSYDDLSKAVKNALAAVKGVTGVITPAELGLRAPAGTMIVSTDDGEQRRYIFKDVTPKNGEGE